MDKGREAASSQRFSYFGSLAEGEGGGGDGACEGTQGAQKSQVTQESEENG